MTLDPVAPKLFPNMVTLMVYDIDAVFNVIIGPITESLRYKSKITYLLSFLHNFYM